MYIKLSNSANSHALSFVAVDYNQDIKGGNMKKAIILLAVILLLVPTFTFAQSQVKATKIIDQINNGKAIQYKNAEIIGDLDFRSIDDVTPGKKNRERREETRRKNWSTNVYWYNVKSPVSFISCVFSGDVIGYFHDDKKNETHNVIFHGDVNFQGCEFKGKSAFKYAKFLEKANFKDTKYHKEALFKYTSFSTDISFSNAHFYGDANFKYTKFPQSVHFDSATFQGDANFKYTKFPQSVHFNSATFQDYVDFKYVKFPKGVSFENAEFDGDACFKYTKFYEPVNFDGVDFKNDVDFKYTKIDGKSFTRYLLKKKFKK